MLAIPQSMNVNTEVIYHAARSDDDDDDDDLVIVDGQGWVYSPMWKQAQIMRTSYTPSTLCFNPSAHSLYGLYYAMAIITPSPRRPHSTLTPTPPPLPLLLPMPPHPL